MHDWPHVNDLAAAMISCSQAWHGKGGGTEAKTFCEKVIKALGICEETFSKVLLGLLL